MTNEPEEGEFFQKLRAAHPEAADLLDAHKEKQSIALALREVRMVQGLSKAELSEISGLSLRRVDQMEAPIGRLPSIRSIKHDASACNATVGLDFTFDVKPTNAVGDAVQRHSTKDQLECDVSDRRPHAATGRRSGTGPDVPLSKPIDVFMLP